MHLHQLGDDLLRVTAVVGDRRADLEGGELDELREHVREREVEVGDLAGQQRPDLEHDRAQRHRVAVREHAALRRAGRARRVDDQRRIVGRDRVAATADELLALAARRRDVVERDDAVDGVVDASTTKIERSAGSAPRTASILASCAASSTTTATAPEFPATHSHSSGEFVG